MINFDNAKAGALPPGWTSAMTHNGGAPRWEVRSDDTAPSKPNVLAQLSDDRTSGRFPLAIYDKASIKDGEVSVRCKSIAGRADQACGLVWRYRDANNYYIVRANALENNVVLYKVENGERKSIAPKGTASRTYGVKHPVPKAAWNELRASFTGTRVLVSFNGKQILEAEDTTFADAGKVGLWTKADSVTHFDDFTFSGK
jgi:hypothetical protein